MDEISGLKEMVKYKQELESEIRADIQHKITQFTQRTGFAIDDMDIYMTKISRLGGSDFTLITEFKMEIDMVGQIEDKLSKESEYGT